MDDIETHGRKYSISNLFGGGWTALSRRFGLMLLLTLTLSFVPTILASLLLGALSVHTAVAVPGAQFAAMRANTGPFLLFYLLTFAITAVHLAAMTRAGVETLGGRAPRFGDIVREALPRAPRVFAIFVLLAIMVTVGFALLFVPGIIVLIRFSGAIQVGAMEDVGVFDAFRRSANLTRGSRGRIFLAGLVALIAAAGLGLVLVAILGSTAGLLAVVGGANLSTGIASLTVFGGFYLVFSLFLSAYLSCVYAAHYVELRRVREGGSVADLAQVFA